MFAHADRMSRIYPLNLRHFSRFGQDVDIIYTDGKVDPIWPPGSVEDSGYVVMNRISSAKRLLEGIFAIDLKRCAEGTSVGAGSLVVTPSGPLRISTHLDFNGFRLTVFEAVAHEYFHLIQAWILIAKTGDPEAFDKAYAAEHFRLDRKALADNLLLLFDRERMETLTYLRNRFEIAAKHQSAAAKNRLRAEVDRGLWDPVFPVAKMRTMVERAVTH
jgi:hypothetical protein